MAYSYITFASAKSALAQRLTDTTKQFWPDAELGAYILEALQTFNAFANFYRDEFVFNAQANTTWYDIGDSSQVNSTLRPRSQTDQSLLNMIQYHFLEPLSSSYPLSWTGSLQFSLTDLLDALQQTRDEVLSESRCTITESVIAALPGRTFLIDTVVGLRRVVWIPATGLGYDVNTLVPSDLWAQQSFESGFVQNPPGMPLTFRLSTEPPLGFDVDIQPAVPGSWDILTVNAGGNLTTVNSTVLPIPNDWCWTVKWGAMAQLLSRDSVASDAFRAKYCQMRYREALEAMRMAPALLAGRIDNVPVVPTSVTAADAYNANWQGQAAGTPIDIYYAGLNMLALSPTPSSSNFSVTAQVVRNMVLPAVDADFLQVGKDDLSAVLDEAQHLAMFKAGGAEFAETFPLHGNLLRRCALYNSKLSALSHYLEFLDGRGQSDEKLHPSFQGLEAS